MPSSPSPRSLRVRRSMAAAPDEAWARVADVTRMGEWSPETVSAVWRGSAGGPAPGARFRGTNRMGSKTWSSNGTVTACEPGRRFAFHVTIGPFSVADWAYEFEPSDGGGCVVTESWQDRRGALVTWLSPFVTGTKDRARRNQETMTVTLDRLAASAQDR